MDERNCTYSSIPKEPGSFLYCEPLSEDLKLPLVGLETALGGCVLLGVVGMAEEEGDERLLGGGIVMPQELRPLSVLRARTEKST